MSKEGLTEALGETDEAIAEAERALRSRTFRNPRQEVDRLFEALVKAVRSLRDAVANIESS